jgi:hypothetical protein
LLEVSMVASIAGELAGGGLTDRRPLPRAASFRIDGRHGRRRPAR